MNLCGAFERAVPRSVQGYAAPSKAALAQYAQQMYSSFAEAPAPKLYRGQRAGGTGSGADGKGYAGRTGKAVRDALAGNEVG